MHIGGIIFYAMGIFYLWAYKNSINLFRSPAKRRYVHYEELWKNPKGKNVVDDMSYELVCKIFGGVITSIIVLLLNYCARY